jgi:hypothetical protein
MVAADLIPKVSDMRRLTSLLVLVCALAGTSATAQAGAILGGNCGSLSPAFSTWSDSASYYFAPNGGFESGTTGWTLSGGAGVTNGNDPFNLSGHGTHALSIPAGGSAAITVCYGLTYPAVRFVASGVGGNAVIHVRVVSRSLLGVLSTLDGGRFTVGSSWAPSPKLSTLFSALASPVGAKTMQLQISVESGKALIDDLYVDPFLTKG